MIKRLTEKRKLEIRDWFLSDFFVDNPNKSDVNEVIQELFDHIFALELELKTTQQEYRLAIRANELLAKDLEYYKKDWSERGNKQCQTLKEKN